eukprot:maker-scaffold47_size466558-snap-gene-3.42 protein:Tk04185 transcript:maker-scaffold47_size466558-snap-gene-3.42-mRNA-1 annotation:"PREDICTED: uncharacterized protein LOC100891328"
MKGLVAKCSDTREDIREAMCAWRNTPRADGYSPAQILFGRRQGTGLPTLPGHHNAIDWELAVGRRDATAVRALRFCPSQHLATWAWSTVLRRW